jgi:hypothetical protein
MRISQSRAGLAVLAVLSAWNGVACDPVRPGNYRGDPPGGCPKNCVNGKFVVGS